MVIQGMSKTAPTLGIIKINFKIERNVIDDYKKFKDSIGYNKSQCDIVNIALHISLKNFEQQCDGINIHFATLRGYLFH